MAAYYLLFRTAVLACGIMIAGHAASTRESSRRLVGGFRPADVKNERAVDAAKFAVESLRDDRYSFKKMHLSTPLNVHLLEAEQQVVAGMNYKLTVMVTDYKDHCIGAFTATVWAKLDGNFSVTHWGEEVPCEEATAILKMLRENSGDTADSGER